MCINGGILKQCASSCTQRRGMEEDSKVLMNQDRSWVSFCFLIQFLLLTEATLVLTQRGKSPLHISGTSYQQFVCGKHKAPFNQAAHMSSESSRIQCRESSHIFQKCNLLKAYGSSYIIGGSVSSPQPSKRTQEAAERGIYIYMTKVHSSLCSAAGKAKQTFKGQPCILRGRRQELMCIGCYIYKHDIFRSIRK